MITETVYAGRDNTFSLQLFRGSEAVNLMAVQGYSLVVDGLRSFADRSLFNEKPDGVVEIRIGHLLAAEEAGSYRAHLVTFDPVNTQGVRWPDFKLKIKEA